MSDSVFRPQRDPLVQPGGIELFATDMTATIAADVPLQIVQQKLLEVGQWLPIDGDPQLPVGNLVEMNSTGPLRLGFGAWRDLLLGCQFLNHDNERITAGGRAFKNVAGYDLTKLMVGQQGMLGKIVTITARTYLRPTAALVVSFPLESSLVNRLLPTPCRPQWMMMNSDNLLAGYLGNDRYIDFTETKVAAWNPVHSQRMSPDDEEKCRDASWNISPPGDRAMYRAAVPPVRVLEWVKAAAVQGWVADPVFGIVRGTCDASAFPALRDTAKSVGGRAWQIGGTPAPVDVKSNDVLERLIGAFAKNGVIAS